MNKDEIINKHFSVPSGIPGNDFLININEPDRKRIHAAMDEYCSQHEQEIKELEARSDGNRVIAEARGEAIFDLQTIIDGKDAQLKSLTEQHEQEIERLKGELVDEKKRLEGYIQEKDNEIGKQKRRVSDLEQQIFSLNHSIKAGRYRH